MIFNKFVAIFACLALSGLLVQADPIRRMANRLSNEVPSMPDIHMPHINAPKMPNIHMPDVNMPSMPEMHMPSMPNMPDVHMPDMHIPDMHMPDMHMPEMRMPRINMPEMPDMHMPRIRMPDMSMPNMPSMPNINMPRLPGTSDMPSMSSLRNSLRNMMNRARSYMPSVSY